MANQLGRQQVGIDRLPVRRNTAENRESMNCKSCRKRKIKCNRLRPTCEACNVFQCACVYDAIPKKRGPKTDVLESLLKRVDGLERRLRDEQKPDSDSREGREAANGHASTTSPISLNTSVANGNTLFSPVSPSPPTPKVNGEVLIDLYFMRVQDKPFHIVDEATVREQHRLNTLPQCLRMAIYSLGARFANNGSYPAALRMSEEYATEARNSLNGDVDEPSIEGLQTILLIHMAFLAAGKGRKAYMLLSTAISMAIVLDLHRELPVKAKVTPVERELRRQLFWTCYLMDRLTASGSKRPSLISDKSMVLRLPSWSPHPGAPSVEGEYFSVQTSLQHAPGSGRLSQGSMGMLIDIARILGVTNRYLATGGVRGDSHFPWHSLSTLSKIRQDLDGWAAANQDVFMDIAMLGSQPDSVILILSKMVYHLIHCLIYRPFLPVDLAELRGTGQHQSWQIESTNLCFLHANAIGDLARLRQHTPTLEWPGFTGYCFCTAGTVHVHGVHYNGQEGDLYSSSAEYLSLEMQHLSELRFIWATVQHQKELLQTLYACHSKLVKSLASNHLRFSPVFHLEDFFDRYPGQSFDGAHITFVDIPIDAIPDGIVEMDGVKMEVPSENYAAQAVTMTPLQTQMLASGTQSHHPHGSHHRRYTDTSIPRPNIHIKDPKPQAPSAIPPQLSHIAEYPSPFSAHLNSPIASNPFSPSFSFSPLPQQPQFDSNMFSLPPDHNGSAMGNYAFDQPMQTAMTPSGHSQSGSTHTNETDKDPFLTLLEQLAENEHSRGGPSDLDFYLGVQEG